MRILVMGGTWFLGKAVAETALAKGWDVTTFNRGRSGVDVPGVEAVRGDRAVREDLQKLAQRSLPSENRGKGKDACARRRATTVGPHPRVVPRDDQLGR